MQTEPGNFRYRGWRESKRLVEIAKSAPCDLKETTDACQQFENTYEVTEGYLDTLTQTVVSQIQHLRSQIFYRVKKDSG